MPNYSPTNRDLTTSCLAQPYKASVADRRAHRKKEIVNFVKQREYYINILRDNAFQLNQQFGITSMLLFGSVARGEHKMGSDVDLLVDMPPVMYNAVAASQYLENLLGCKVDLVRNHRNIKPSFLEQVKQDGVQIYTTA